MISDHLCDFLMIVKVGSFTLAAEELFVSQSCLSKRIKALEDELGVQLFDRTSRNIVLSEAGELLVPYAQQLYELKKALLRTMAEYSQQQSSGIKVVSVPVMIQYDITSVVGAFQKSNPDIQLTLIEGEPCDMPGLLETGACDFAFARRFEDEDCRFEFTKFYPDRLMALLSKNHPLAQEEQIELAQLRNEKFLFMSKVTGVYDLCYNLCLEAGFTPQVIHTGRWPDNIIELVANGMGVSMIMKGYIDYAQNDQVRGIRLNPDVDNPLCLARLKGRRLSGAALAFWHYVQRLGESASV